MFVRVYACSTTYVNKKENVDTVIFSRTRGDDTSALFPLSFNRLCDKRRRLYESQERHLFCLDPTVVDVCVYLQHTTRVLS